MRVINRKYKEGAASFYIVAFATLVLMVIAASFAAIIISEVTRTSNDDLAQSAYDSALAGVEDAKLAYYNYQNCIENNPAGCGDLVEQIENPNLQSCTMVADMIGRGTTEDGWVEIQESVTNGNNMQQAYTCVKIETVLDDYTATLSNTNQTKVVRVKFDNDIDGNGVDNDVNVADMVDKVVISWYADGDSNKYRYTNFQDDGSGSGRVTFPPVIAGAGSIAVDTRYAYAAPPTISVTMIQASESFGISDFEMTVGDQTNQGTVYLVPTDNKTWASTNRSGEGAYIGAFDGSKNHINSGGMLKSNDKTSANLPYAVYCEPDGGNEYVCSATIDLPKPVGGLRNGDVFVFAVSLPYGQPGTDFEMKFYCADGTVCSTTKDTSEDGVEIDVGTSLARLKDVQIKIDSTGRANDLYRRVETRLEGGDEFSLSALGPLELLGDDDDEALLDKNYIVTTEYNF